MSLHKLSAGDGYTYLTRQVAAADDTNRGYSSLGSYYEQKGESPGVWIGSGLGSLGDSVPEFRVAGSVTEAQMTALFGEGRHPNADVIERRFQREGVRGRALDRATRLGQEYRTYDANPFRERLAARYREHNQRLDRPLGAPIESDGRARIRTELAREMFTELHGRPPSDGRELSGFLARASRPAPVAVAGYDLTFSPVKSVSALWAIAPRDVSELIAQAHQDAVADTIGWLEKHAAYTRRGAQGIAQVDSTGFIAAAFTHRDSRAGDPDLHTHVAVSNKVCTRDGSWLSLDGRALYKNKVAASERYNTRLEALLTDRLGLSFADRKDGFPDKRAVREIVGLDGELLRVWSSRRADIEPALAELRLEFQADHGRPPTTIEGQKLAQQATLDTREGKHLPRSLRDQRASWRAEAITVLGDERFSQTLRRVLTPQRRSTRPLPDVDAVAREVVATIQAERATWQSNHVRAEAERQVRCSAAVPHVLMDQFVDDVVARTLSPALSIALTPHRETDEPTALRRADGTSVYEIAGSHRYSSTAILDAEQRVLAHANRRDGRALDPSAIALALLEGTANGVQLGADQAAMVRELAGSGARVQLVLAPAGTGKTVTMRAVAHAWTASGGNVIGLAPSAAAARVLGDELGEYAVAADTLAKLVHAITTGAAVPPWFNAIDASSLVVIDEAGMAGTIELATVVDHVIARGGSIRLIGDNQQLAAIGAGGVLRDIHRQHGAATLTNVRRFTHPDGSVNHAEAAASLALRDGDPAAIAFYTDHERIHVGDATTALDQAYRAWAADRAAGLDAILLAPTCELVRELNTRARLDRLVANGGPMAHQVQLSDGTYASAGDQIITRRNDRRLATSATDWVTNGDRWKITRVHSDGAIDVSHASARRRATLPPDYVGDHVVLGYATTVHGAQGLTADTSHVVMTGSETRQLLYVALTRGRTANYAYLDVTTGADPHAVTDPDSVRPPTAVEILARVLERDDTATSATAERRALRDPGELLRKNAAEYLDALGVAAESVIGPINLASMEHTVESMSPGLTDCPAWPALKSKLMSIGLDDANPYAALQRALHAQPLDSAADAAAVLSWRLQYEDSRSPGPLPGLPPVPAQLAQDSEWGRYLDRRVKLLTRDADLCRAAAAMWTAETAPAWATRFVEHDRDLTGELAVWRAVNAVPDTDARPTGPPRADLAGWRSQHELDRRTERRVFGSSACHNFSAQALADGIDPRLAGDPHWSALARQLENAHHQGVDISALARHAASGRPLPDEQPAAALHWRLVDAIAATRTKQHPDTSKTTGVPLQRTASRRTYVDEPAPARSRPPDIDYARAFGNKPAPGRGVSR
jgi:conjugative relaxase-like TrwC/TraI family protein